VEFTEKQKEAVSLTTNLQHFMIYGGSRCVSGDTIIDGQSKTIKELAEIGKPVEVLTTRGKVLAEAPFKKGECELLEFKLKSGRSVKVTPDHRFYTGKKWQKASEFKQGDSLAVQSSEPYLQQSNLELSLSKSLVNVQRWKKITSNWMDRCFSHLRQYGQQPLPFSTSAQEYHALRCGELERSRSYQRQPFLFSQSLESNNHTDYQKPPFLKYNPIGQSLSRRPSLGDSPLKMKPFQLLNCDDGQICELSQGSRSIYQQSPLMSFFWKSFLAIMDSVLFQFALFFGLSYDKPRKKGYDLSTVTNITKTAKQNYYTLHVPVAEQYFANGILHHNSGKTFILVRNLILRALKSPDSRHVILRYRFNHVKSSIVHDTFPKVMKLCFPTIQYKLDKTDWYATFDNGAQVWFGGLDDKERTEKILGTEYATIYLNECSQISYSSVEIVTTRLAQKIYQQTINNTKELLPLRMLYDCNPPLKSHWTYKLFLLKANPDTKKPLPNPNIYGYMKINPSDNMDNLPQGYLDTLRGMSERRQKRFLHGEFGDDNPNALFTESNFEINRIKNGEKPDMTRIIVSVDPSGAGDVDNQENDAIGIVVVGIGTDGRAYLLEDCTIKAGPATWGKVATEAYYRWSADCIVAEKNYGGEMVRFTIQTARQDVPFKFVTATRGKVVRAEPVSALYELGKVRHVGKFNELEDELIGFSTFGYLGEKSPNRADALVWAVTELFPRVVNDNKEAEIDPISLMQDNFGW
jgi:PBSX family phage terminase large subunit